MLRAVYPERSERAQHDSAIFSQLLTGRLIRQSTELAARSASDRIRYRTKFTRNSPAYSNCSISY